MIFKLVAFYFLLTNGVPADQPMGSATYNQQTFPSEEACVQFIKSEVGQAVTGALQKMVPEGKATIKFACVSGKPPGEEI